ncbi:hypothetical protein FRB98_002177 [Tulasnella sp. 332]|nr:hypothetical protein FRB98_002177 [Tulasnella sp. 332]
MLQEDAIAVCLIDGDGAIFSDDLLQRGQDGGVEAARQLKEGLLKHINENHGIKPRETKVMIFMNVFGLGWTLERHGICHSHVFRQFILGFNQATPLFSIIDVGNGKEAADAKLRGQHDAGYIPTLKSMQNEGNIEKMTILEGYTQAAFEARKFAEVAKIGMTRIPGLFRLERLENLSVPVHSQNASRNDVISPSWASSVATSEAGDLTPGEQGGPSRHINNGKRILQIDLKKPFKYRLFLLSFGAIM